MVLTFQLEDMDCLNLKKKSCIFYLFDGAGILVQDFTIARKALYHLSQSSNPNLGVRVCVCVCVCVRMSLHSQDIYKLTVKE
jgi:hypothetical protein